MFTMVDEVCHYEIQQNDKYGRYLVANKDLAGGDLIFTDLPFAVGPKPGKYLLEFFTISITLDFLTLCNRIVVTVVVVNRYFYRYYLVISNVSKFTVAMLLLYRYALTNVLFEKELVGH